MIRHSLIFLPIVLVSSFAGAEVTQVIDFETVPYAYDSFASARGPFPDNFTSELRNVGTNFENIQTTSTGTVGTGDVGRLTINNSWNPTFGSFAGFVGSQRTAAQRTGQYGNGNDTVTASGIGAFGSASWLVAGGSGVSFLETDGLSTIDSLFFNNTQTAAEIIETGNQFSRPFGGPGGTIDDLFTVRFVDASVGSTGNAIERELASFDSTTDTLSILSDWTQVDLTSLDSNRISIEFVGTDNDPIFGLNTPAFVAIDNVAITSVPEPSFIGVLAIGGLGWLARRRRDQHAS